MEQLVTAPVSLSLMAPEPDLRVEVFERAADLETHVPAWQQLADQALESNAFYEPWMLRPALEHLGRAEKFVLALVWHKHHGLIGFFPFVRIARYKKFPVRGLALWQHPHCVLCTPLLQRDFAREAFSALLDWAPRMGTILEFPMVHAEGPFQKLLVDLAMERKIFPFVDEIGNRAFLQPAEGAEDYIAHTLSTGNRKELRRQRKRLGEQGRLETKIMGPLDDTGAWIDQFLALEASGWKGSEGTALRARQDERAFFHAAVRNAAAMGKLMLLGLFLDDQPIALKCSFRAGRGAFALKIGFNEDFAKFSPGVQLELENIEAVCKTTNLDWMDSCAVSRHFMINRLWRERRTIQNIALSTGKRRGDLLLGLLPMLRALRRLIRRR